MRRIHRANIELIKIVANRIGPLLDKVVFLGGAATGLLITDTAAPLFRCCTQLLGSGNTQALWSVKRETPATS